MKKVNVLGTEYTVRETSDDMRFSDCNAYFDWSEKECVINSMEREQHDVMSLQNIDEYKKKLVRHELLHAFCYESGLGCCSWADNEEIIDFLAIQFCKIADIFKQAECL